jgi:hypothetical protein
MHAPVDNSELLLEQKHRPREQHLQAYGLVSRRVKHRRGAARLNVDRILSGVQMLIYGLVTFWTSTKLSFFQLQP